MGVLWAVFSTFSLSIIIAWCWLVMFRPRIVGRIVCPGQFGHRVLPSWLAKALGWLAAAAVCAILYNGLVAFLGWMPDSWGSLSRSGDAPEWEPVRSTIAGVLAALFTILAAYASLHIAEIRANAFK